LIGNTGAAASARKQEEAAGSGNHSPSTQVDLEEPKLSDARDAISCKIWRMHAGNEREQKKEVEQEEHLDGGRKKKQKGEKEKRRIPEEIRKS
jgi:hypothetical protein